MLIVLQTSNAVIKPVFTLSSTIEYRFIFFEPVLDFYTGYLPFKVLLFSLKKYKTIKTFECVS